MRIRTFVIACLAAFSVMGAGATTSQADNVANLEIEAFESTSFDLYWAPCEYSFDRSAWSGGGGGWTSSWTNFEETSGDCVDNEWSSSAEFEVTKSPLYGSVGTFEAQVSFIYDQFQGQIRCRYAGTISGYWTNQPGTPDRKRFFFPAHELNRVSGSFLCPSQVGIRSDTPALDVLAEY
jgi:hypothetical protein